jgi:hypothetical protein
MAEPAKLTKFTGQELRQRGIGDFADPEGTGTCIPRFRTKKETYADEGVIKSYRSLYTSFSVLLVPSDSKSTSAAPDKYAAAKCAQMMIDACLLRGSRGEKVEIPNKVHLYEIKKESKEEAAGIELYDASLFEDDGSVSENEKLRWIFENLQVEGIEPSDAPSMGAYTYLMHLRGNAQAMQKFYDSAWPKLLSKEDAERTGKLEDTGKSTIQLIERLEAALPEKEAE